jgi:hypothetical protein
MSGAYCSAKRTGRDERLFLYALKGIKNLVQRSKRSVMSGFLLQIMGLKNFFGSGGEDDMASENFCIAFQ